jgi:hypothetical protein
MSETDDPRYAHNCAKCLYLGHYAESDLYFCTAQVIGIPTVLARFGNEPEVYVSGLALAEKVPELAEAKRRARARGLLP